MFKKVAVLVSLIALSVPVMFGEGIIDFGPDEYVEYNVHHPVIAHHTEESYRDYFGCTGYLDSEAKVDLCNTDQVNVSYVEKINACGPPCGGDPEPGMEHPEDKIWGSPTTAYKVYIEHCAIPCGGDPVL